MEKIPISIITGHLGSGKTSLIQKILEEFKEQKILVIENEFGEIGIDGEILDKNENALVEMNSGCVCCNIQSELEVYLQTIISEKPDFDHIIIEATGVANPAKIASLLAEPSYLSNYFPLNSILCVIDAVNFEKHLNLPEFELQLLTSDSFYLSKKDMAEAKTNDYIADALNLSGQELQSEGLVESFLSRNSFRYLDPAIPLKGGHGHYDRIAFEFDGEFDPFTLENYLNLLFMQYMGRIFRSKGVLFFRKAPHPVIFQGVFDSLSFEEVKDFKSKSKTNRLVFIGEKLDKKSIGASLENCLETGN